MRLIRSVPAIAALVFVAACDLSTDPRVPDPIDPASDTYATSLGINIASMTRMASGVYYKDLVVGTGTGAAAVNDSVSLRYTLWLTNGTKIDSNTDAGAEVFKFKIGDAQFIPGFSLGMIGMLPGGTRVLVIPTQLAWGEGGARTQGKPPIPPNSNVVFQIQFIERLSAAQ